MPDRHHEGDLTSRLAAAVATTVAADITREVVRKVHDAHASDHHPDGVPRFEAHLGQDDAPEATTPVWRHANPYLARSAPSPHERLHHDRKGPNLGARYHPATHNPRATHVPDLPQRHHEGALTPREDRRGAPDRASPLLAGSASAPLLGGRHKR